MPDREELTSRERIQTALRHERPDRLPLMESLWEGVPELWRMQGMPADVAPADYFGFDISFMSLDTSPRFEMPVQDRSDGYITYTDRFGYTCRKPDGKSGTLDFLDHPVKDRAAWEDVRRRLQLSDDPTEPARIDDASYFAHFDPYPTWDEALAKYVRAYDAGRYMLFTAYGPWEVAWRLRGFDGVLMDVAADPDWVGEIVRTYADLQLAVLAKCFDLGMKPDGFFMVEDLGCNHGTLISPASWRELFRPSLAKLGEFLAAEGVDLWMHCCGDVTALVDDFVECGLRVLQPLQVSAGMDMPELRKRYGKRLSYWGNISAAAMSGEWDPLEQDILRKVPLAVEGGYIFGSDHSVPPDISFDRYEQILRTARGAFDEVRGSCE